MPNTKTERECPRCGRRFHCEPQSLAGCQCQGIVLPPALKDYLAQRYDGCLCIHCLRTLKTEGVCIE